MAFLDFVGQYSVAQGSHTAGEDETVTVQVGDQVYIGTGEDHDSAPPDPKNQTVGFSVYDGDIRRIPAPGKPPLIFQFRDNTLNYEESDLAGQPVRCQIALYQQPDYKAVYGLILQGDPEQVGVWGADGNPPPGPDGNDRPLRSRKTA